MLKEKMNLFYKWCQNSNDCFWLPKKVDVTIKDSESYMPSEV